MTIEARMDRWERRQELMISTIGDLATIMGSTHDLVVELMAWLKEPPSSDIPELISGLLDALKDFQESIDAQREQIAALAATLAQMVQDGGAAR
jgi:hypothetical protein